MVGDAVALLVENYGEYEIAHYHSKEVPHTRIAQSLHDLAKDAPELIRVKWKDEIIKKF